MRVGLRSAFTAGIGLAVLAPADPGHAKTPGSTYCYFGICHRVLTLAECRAAVGVVATVLASHYDSPDKDPYNPRLETSSGEMFDPSRDDNVASPIYPDGTRLVVRNPANHRTAIVRVNNAGPYMGNRRLDVSRKLALRLGFFEAGVAKLEVLVLSAPTEAEATYRRHRKYPRVPGLIGEYPSIALAALADAEGSVALALDAPKVAGGPKVAGFVARARVPKPRRPAATRLAAAASELRSAEAEVCNASEQPWCAIIYQHGKH